MRRQRSLERRAARPHPPRDLRSPRLRHPRHPLEQLVRARQRQLLHQRPRQPLRTLLHTTECIHHPARCIHSTPQPPPEAHPSQTVYTPRSRRKHRLSSETAQHQALSVYTRPVSGCSEQEHPMGAGGGSDAPRPRNGGRVLQGLTRQSPPGGSPRAGRPSERVKARIRSGLVPGAVLAGRAVRLGGLRCGLRCVLVCPAVGLTLAVAVCVASVAVCRCGWSVC